MFSRPISSFTSLSLVKFLNHLTTVSSNKECLVKWGHWRSNYCVKDFEKCVASVICCRNPRYQISDIRLRNFLVHFLLCSVWVYSQISLIFGNVMFNVDSKIIDRCCRRKGNHLSQKLYRSFYTFWKHHVCWSNPRNFFKIIITFKCIPIVFYIYKYSYLH